MMRFSVEKVQQEYFFKNYKRATHFQFQRQAGQNVHNALLAQRWKHRDKHRGSRGLAYKYCLFCLIRNFRITIHGN